MSLKPVDFVKVFKDFDKKYDNDAAFQAAIAGGAASGAKKAPMESLLAALNKDLANATQNSKLYQEQLALNKTLAKKELVVIEAVLKKAGKKIDPQSIKLIDASLDGVREYARKTHDLSSKIWDYLIPVKFDFEKEINRRGGQLYLFKEFLAKSKAVNPERSFESAVIARIDEYVDRGIELKKTALKIFESNWLESEQKSLKKAGSTNDLNKVNEAAIKRVALEIKDFSEKSKTLYSRFMIPASKADGALGVISALSVRSPKQDVYEKHLNSLKGIEADIKNAKGAVKTHEMLLKAYKDSLKASDSVFKVSSELKDDAKVCLKELGSCQDVLEKSEKDLNKAYANAVKHLDKIKKLLGLK